MASYSFLHAADIHLDSPLAGLRARGDLPEALIRDCTRRAFSAMVDLAIAEQVAFVVIAGDLYDGDWKDFSTGLFFASEMRRLGCPCFLLRGNHDARSVITRALKPPGNVREFSSRTCESFVLDGLDVVLHGHSFPNRSVPEDLSAGYPAPHPGRLNIGVLHSSAEDPGEHETYAPCSVAALTLKGYDYWALGHVHERRVLAERPWVVFPGNMQGRHARETGAKGCSLVRVEENCVVAVEHRVLDLLRWVTLEVEAADDAALLGQRMKLAVQSAAAACDARPMLARLTVTGESGLTLDPEQLAAECRNAAIEADAALWVESVKLRARAAPPLEAELLAPLHEAFAAGLDDPALRAALLEDLAALRQRLPAAARVGLDLPQDEDSLRALAGEAWTIAAGLLRP